MSNKTFGKHATKQEKRASQNFRKARKESRGRQWHTNKED